MEIQLTKINKWLFCFLLSLSPLGADLYEGVEAFKNRGRVDLEMLPQFLPCDPIIVDAGALYGDETLRAAQLWPEGHIFAFEPNPHAYFKLRKNIKNSTAKNIQVFKLALSNYNGSSPFHICYGMKGDDASFEYASSMLPLYSDMQMYCKGAKIEVPCMILDDWCRQEGIDHIDLLRLELEGSELTVLKSSPEVLKKLKVLYVKTISHPHRLGMTQSYELKDFLEQAHFVLLSHWYTPGIIGYAIYLSRETFDAYSRKSLD